MKVLIVAALVAYCSAAPSGHLVGVATHQVGVAHHQTVVGHTPARAHVSESYHAGPAIAHTHVEHGVVGHRTVQVGTQPVQVGHQYSVVGQDVEHQPAYTYVAGEAVNTQHTVPIAPPPLPYASAAAPIIPPAPVNHGPAPADTVTQEKILAPSRTHTVVTPQVTRIEPELHVNRYAVEVPVHVPVPVEREVVVEKVVQKPYHVEVPRPVAVPQPYKVHQVHEVVETPIVKQHTVSVHQPVAVAHHVAAPVAVAHHAAYAAAPVAHAAHIAAPVVHKADY